MNAYTATIFTTGSIFAILAVSLSIVVGYTGQVSLAQGALFGVGAYTAAIATLKFGIPYPMDLIVSIALTAAMGMLVALPAVRLRTDFLILTTIGINFVVVAIFQYSSFFGAAGGIVGIAPLTFTGGSGAPVTGLVIAFCTFLICLVVAGLVLRTWFGQRVRAVRDDEDAARSLGISLTSTKLWAFAISGAICGVAGWLYAHFVGSVFPGEFGFLTSVQILAMVIVGGSGSLIGPALVAFVLIWAETGVPALETYRLVFYGALVVIFVLLVPTGILGENSSLRSFIGRLRPAARLGADANDARASLSPGTPARLSVAHVSKRFGGNHVLTDVTVDAAPGEILGIIGPNGAGKSTLFNVISGLIPADSGAIELDGASLVGVSVQGRARAGIGRTFQTARLFTGMSVLQQVRLGAGIVFTSSFRRSMRRPVPRDPKVLAILDLVGLTEVADRDATALSLADQRLVEIARGVAMGSRVVLLDEPGAGLTHQELAELSAALRTLRDSGITVIVIEHSVDFIMGTCDRVVVLTEGKILVAGTPAEVRADPRVIAAYLGQPQEQAS